MGPLHRGRADSLPPPFENVDIIPLSLYNYNPMNTRLSSKKIAKYEIGSRIKRARGNDTQREFAKKLLFSSNYLSEVESGKTKPSLELLLMISHITKYSLHWLLTGQGPLFIEATDSMVREDPASYGALGELIFVPGLSCEDEVGRDVQGVEEAGGARYAFRRQWLQSKGSVEELVHMEARGDSMEPTIADGDMVLINSAQKKVIGGTLYALRTKNAVMVKRLQPIGTARLQVMSDNKLYDSYEIDLDIGDIEIIGQVVWIGREVVR
jgi:phage repressor protein C with HTH and peptisase S24 domain